uniref:Uncharacterized protein n=1 Tax=Sphaerodactylus townsendi TaxID=933632 RepID=A0ACB8FK07_9SAUR
MPASLLLAPPFGSGHLWDPATRHGSAYAGSRHFVGLASQALLPHSQDAGPSIYTVIPPNLSRRNQLQRIANKELEELEKWKEQHRPGVICLTPQMLGGAASEADVRRKQQLEHSQSKYQQKLKREQYERVKREAEEAELLKKKAVQREKVRQS